ncbi:NADH dehydrogenase [ubiquinone] 1 alpha subcomplex subunit 10, mitochondrial-like isoform X2 [Gordionus sp. m RMFG-2023]|uniref:NADH dehydrogenase [ubiquinone] 1 alpha subcomplex subunit 10, mitochondrial-like isoform X2 n=1 Tax=Gordionus sp. m RMFG-2023 TaxID=3053472 RepID=UPI0031FD1EBC
MNVKIIHLLTFTKKFSLQSVIYNFHRKQDTVRFFITSSNSNIKVNYYPNLLKCCRTYLNIQTNALYSLASKGIDPNLPEYEINNILERPKPFPYQTHSYNSFWSIFDGTLKRWDENSKLIVVDGNIGSGKSEFAHNLAKAMGMKFYKKVSLDMLYIDEYGFDQRVLNTFLLTPRKNSIFTPLPGQSYPDFRDVAALDLPDFYADPGHKPSSAKLRFKIMFLKCMQYLDALEHLYNTGQGCVIDSSFFSDFVELEAMFQRDYLSIDARNHMFHERGELLMNPVKLNYPHLVIYLDVSPEICLERIKTRNIPYEVNSSVFKNTDYLKAMDEAFKKFYFADMEQYSEVVVYDWSKFGAIDWVMDDISKLDLEFHLENVYRMKDWYYHNDNTLGRKRKILADRDGYYSFFHPFVPSVGEFNADPNHLIVMDALMQKVIRSKVRPAYLH